MADRVGEQLGNYRLVRLLGQGGFAEVYLGEHVYLETQAAIKVLRTQLARADTEPFRLEAKRIAHLLHPHIVQVLDFGVEGTTPFLVMSYAPGGTLRQRHSKGTRLPLPLIVQYVKQMADALQYAHKEKFIHCDVKPENMLLGRRNEVLLSDFGIAVVAHSPASQRTEDKIGTALYMAPEQWRGKPLPATDQYALGIIVYEWLCGECPFGGGTLQLQYQHTQERPPLLRGKVSTIPPEVEQVVMTALAKDPNQRFKSVQAFADALEQAVPTEVIVPPPPDDIPRGWGVCPKCGFKNRPGAKFCQLDRQLLALPPPEVLKLLEELKLAKDLKLSDPKIYFDIGYKLNEHKSYQEALDAYEKAIHLNPKDAVAHCNKGYTLNQLGRYKDALVALDRAISLDRKYALAHFNRGYSLNELKQYQEALDAYDQAIRFNPQYALAHSNKGYTLYQLRRYDEALAALDQAIGLNPKYALAHNNRGLTLHELGRYDEALAAYDQAIRLDPNDAARVYFNKAITLTQMGRWAEAQAARKRAQELGYTG